MTDSAKSIVKQYLEELHNNRNLSVIDEFKPAGYKMESSVRGTTDSDGIKASMSSRFAAIPDHHLEIVEQIAEDDRVFTRYVMRGTLQGEFGGVAGAGQKIEQNGVFVHTVLEGKIVQSWGLSDWHGVRSQIGDEFVPPRHAPPSGKN